MKEKGYRTCAITSLGALILNLWVSWWPMYNIKEITKKKDQHKKSNSYYLAWQSHSHDISLLEPVLSLPHHFFSTRFWWFKQRCAVSHSCEHMPPRSLHVLPFRLYCQPAYPALMELLKTRYEQNLGGPAFVRACVFIRWERGDKNLSNACRSCHSMHNNLRLGGWKKNTVRQDRKGRLRDEYV